MTRLGDRFDYHGAVEGNKVADPQMQKYVDRMRQMRVDKARRKRKGHQPEPRRQINMGEGSVDGPQAIMSPQAVEAIDAELAKRARERVAEHWANVARAHRRNGPWTPKG